MAEPNLPPELEVFRKDVGTWDAEIEITLQPGAPPLASKGVSENRLRHGDRWLIVDFENETGFGGHGIYGFDAQKKKYTGVWVDPTRTSLAVMEGEWDASSKTMTMRGELTRHDGGKIAWRETTQTIDANTQVFRSYVPGPDGKEFEMMKVTYRRRAT